ncbi:carboxylesterase [Bipolaris maydis]|nr:carboxylesterase [Bipolaris maydis]
MANNTKSYKLKAGSLGYLEGLTISSGSGPALHYFGGLPYALPPTGAQRFRPPRKLPTTHTYGTEACPGRFAGASKVCPQGPSRNPPEPSTIDEDCLQLNVWIPSTDAPKEGWPVLFYIHGGFLQVGTSNWKPSSLVSLLGESAFKAIVVVPTYRLNVFGFLTGAAFAAEAESGETSAVGNMGFWDQRTALEWVHANISNFCGNPHNITVGGYSAGAYSTFHQLAHELYQVPAGDQIIKRVIMLSNGPGVRPKTLQEHQVQFEELLCKLDIPANISDAKKLALLRAIPYQQLVDAQKTMVISEFKPMADGKFYPQNLFTNINSGDFARRMKNRGIKLFSGECRDEHTIYRVWRTPEDSLNSLRVRFCAEYPAGVVDDILNHYCGSEGKLPGNCENWPDLFGRIYADLQVHGLQRGFYNALLEEGLEPGKDVFRYSLHRRLDCIKAILPVELGITHTSDIPIWLWGYDFPDGLTDQEKVWLRGWNQQFAAFVKGEDIEWGCTKSNEARRWREDGGTDTWKDSRWEEGLALWKVVHKDL